MTRQQDEFEKLPPIVIGATDHERLRGWAAAAVHSAPDAASLLHSELGRARIVPADDVPPQVVRMGATVEFSIDAGPNRRSTLVYPDHTGAPEGAVSVLTPIGAALIGIAEGQRMAWSASDGRRHTLTVLRVEVTPADDETRFPRNANVVAFSPRAKRAIDRGPSDPDGDDPGPRAA